MVSIPKPFPPQSACFLRGKAYSSPQSQGWILNPNPTTDVSQADRAFYTNRLRAQINIAHLHPISFFRSHARLHA